jgi:hypothetical protein
MEANRVPAKQPTGWTVFAGVILFIVGSLDALFGLAAVLNDQVVLVGGQGVVIASITTWGWIHLILGLAMVVTGMGLFTGSPTARAFAVAFVALNAVAQFVWFPAAPLWSFMLILLDVTIIYQLTARWED